MARPAVRVTSGKKVFRDFVGFESQNPLFYWVWRLRRVAKMGPKVDKRAWKVDKSEGFEGVCQPGRNQTATFVNQAQPVLDRSTGSGELTEDVVDGADCDHLSGQGADRNAAKYLCDHKKLKRHAPREGHALDIDDR